MHPPLRSPPDASHFVGWKIIYDDDFAALEDWDNALPHISKKHRPVHGTVKHERRDHGAIPQAGDKRNYFPMPLRRIADQPLSARTATAQRTMLVLVQVSSINTSRAGSNMPCCRIQRRRAGDSARFCSAAYKLVLKLMFRRSKNRHTALRLPGMRFFRMAATISSNVKSGCSTSQSSSSFLFWIIRIRPTPNGSGTSKGLLHRCGGRVNGACDAIVDCGRDGEGILALHGEGNHECSR